MNGVALIRWRHIWLLALAIKLVLAIALPLSNDEAYYWVWSHHLQWSYYDHPGGVAWLFWLSHVFEPLRGIIPGHDLTGLLRIPGVLLGHATLLIVRKLIGTSISERQHIQWLLVVLLSPFFGIGSLIVTPDVPLVFTWALALLAFKNHLEKSSPKTAVLLGAALGLGFCAKYHIVLFVPIAIAYVAWKREWRTLRPASVVAVIGTGLIFSDPVWGWNAAHDWVSFKFQLNHGLEAQARSGAQKLMQFGDYLGAQLGILSPLVVFTFWKREEPSSLRFLKWFGWGTIAFFAWTSLRSPVEANWPIAGHLSLLVIAAINARRQWLTRGMLALWTVATVVVVYQALHPANDFFGTPAKDLKTHEFIRFQPLEAVAKEDPNLYASSYQMAGALSLAANRTVAKLAGVNRVDFFDFHETGLPQTDSFTVALAETWPWPAWIAERGYKEVSSRQVDRFTLVTFQRTNGGAK